MKDNNGKSDVLGSYLNNLLTKNRKTPNPELQLDLQLGSVCVIGSGITELKFDQLKLPSFVIREDLEICKKKLNNT